MQVARESIEDVRDYVSRNHYDDTVLCTLLEKFWPLPGDDPVQTSGMLCFIALFRVIYCRLSPRHLMDDMIKKTDILRFAMSNFGAETPEEKDNERAACRLMHDGIAKHIGGQVTFAGLMESEMLLKSIWAHEPFRLHYPILCRSDHDSPDWECLPDDIQDVVEAKQGLMVWRTSKHKDIFDALDESEGIFKGRIDGLDKGQVEFSLLRRAPVVMRIKVVFDKRIGGFNISKIYKFVLPRTLVQTRWTPGKRSRNITFEHSPDGYVYRLLAIVRLRGQESEQDYVRLYDLRGQLITPEMEKSSLDMFFDDGWSIQDQDHSLMLFYMRVGSESAAGSYINLTEELGIGQKMFRPTFVGSKGQSIVPSTSPTVPQLSGDAPADELGGVGTDTGDGPVQSQGARSTSEGPRESSQQLPSTPSQTLSTKQAEDIGRMGHTDSPESTVSPKRGESKTLARDIFRMGHTDSPGSSPS